jgi:hypothetical protein
MTSNSSPNPTEFTYRNGDFELTADYYVPDVSQTEQSTSRPLSKLGSTQTSSQPM